MELQRLYRILGQLQEEVERAVGNKVIFECAGESDHNKEMHLRRHHYKVPNGHPRVVAWCRVMPNGHMKVEPKRPCARVSVLAKLLDGDDPQIRTLEWHPRGDWDSGSGEMRAYIYEVDDNGHNHARYALIMACRACLRPAA